MAYAGYVSSDLQGSTRMVQVLVTPFEGNCTARTHSVGRRALTCNAHVSDETRTVNKLTCISDQPTLEGQLVAGNWYSYK